VPTLRPEGFVTSKTQRSSRLTDRSGPSSTERPGVTCRAAAAAISQRAAEWVGSSVPSLVKHVLDRIGQEEHQSNQEELAGRRLCYADGSKPTSRIKLTAIAGAQGY